MKVTHWKMGRRRMLERNFYKHFVIKRIECNWTELEDRSNDRVRMNLQNML